MDLLLSVMRGDRPRLFRLERSAAPGRTQLRMEDHSATRHNGELGI